MLISGALSCLAARASSAVCTCSVPVGMQAGPLAPLLEAPHVPTFDSMCFARRILSRRLMLLPFPLSSWPAGPFFFCTPPPLPPLNLPFGLLPLKPGPGAMGQAN